MNMVCRGSFLERHTTPKLVCTLTLGPYNMPYMEPLNRREMQFNIRSFSTLSSTAATSSKLAAWVAVLERHHPIQKMIYVGNQPLTYLPIGSFLNRLSCRAKAGLDSVHSCVHLLVFSTGQCHEYYLQNCFYRCTPLLYLISHL